MNDAVNNSAPGGDAPPPWTAQLPDDLKGNETLTAHRTLGDLGKGYLDLHGKLQTAVRIPGENATDEERATFYSRLGRPESPDKYEFTRPELPEGMPYDEQSEKDFRAFCHEQGLTGKQATALYDLYHKKTIGAYQGLVEKRKEIHDRSVTEIKKEWGDQYTGNVERAVRVAEKFGGPDFTKFLDQSGLGDNPHLVRVFHAISLALSEDTLSGTHEKPGKEKTPAEVLFPEMKGG